MDLTIYNNKLSGRIAAISSKSYAQRALFLTLLSEGDSEIIIKDYSDDIEMAKAITSKIKSSTNVDDYLELDMGESATCLRLIIPILGVLGQKAILIRRKSLVSRTIDLYHQILPKHGMKIKEDGDKVIIDGKLHAGSYTLPGNVSSQFISGLLLALGSLEQKSKVQVSTEIESLAYINMTMDIMKKFFGYVSKDGNNFICGGGYQGTKYICEGDWSSSLFFLVGGAEVLGLNKDSLQADIKAIDYLRKLGYTNQSQKNFLLKRTISPEKNRTLDASQMPDAIPILSIASALVPGHTEVINVSRLRLKESDRVKSTCHMLENLGLDIDIGPNNFSFYSNDSLKSCKIDSHGDHRIAMSASIAGTFANGAIKIMKADCISKSYPEFYKDFKKLGGFYVK